MAKKMYFPIRRGDFLYNTFWGQAGRRKICIIHFWGRLAAGKYVLHIFLAGDQNSTSKLGGTPEPSSRRLKSKFEEEPKQVWDRRSFARNVENTNLRFVPTQQDAARTFHDDPRGSRNPGTPKSLPENQKMYYTKKV